MSETDYQRLAQKAESAEESLVRNFYLADSTVLEKQSADSLMQVIVARNLANPHLSELSYSRTLVMQVKMGQLTATEAMGKAIRRYRNGIKKEISTARYDYRQLQTALLPFMNYFYLNDQSDVSYRRKRSAVKRMYRDIITIYHHRLDQQMENSYVKYLNILATYPRAIKYLKEEERIRNLNELNVAT